MEQSDRACRIKINCLLNVGKVDFPYPLMVLKTIIPLLNEICKLLTDSILNDYWWAKLLTNNRLKY